RVPVPAALPVPPRPACCRNHAPDPGLRAPSAARGRLAQKTDSRGLRSRGGSLDSPALAAERAPAVAARPAGRAWLFDILDSPADLCGGARVQVTWPSCRWTP